MYHSCFAEFYHLRNGRYETGVGDRSVAIIDGRLSRTHQHDLAAEHARKYGFDGYRLCRGRFSDPFYLTAQVKPVAHVMVR